MKLALACVLLLLIFLTASPRKNRAGILDREHWALSFTSVFATQMSALAAEVTWLIIPAWPNAPSSA